LESSEDRGEAQSLGCSRLRGDGLSFAFCEGLVELLGPKPRGHPFTSVRSRVMELVVSEVPSALASWRVRRTPLPLYQVASLATRSELFEGLIPL
jgi:hypothetical protein